VNPDVGALVSKGRRSLAVAQRLCGAAKARALLERADAFVNDAEAYLRRGEA
jgi:hypothetical protein